MALTKIPGNLIETGAVTGDVLADGGIATAKLANDAVTTLKISDANITHAKLHTSMDLTGKTVTVATASGSTNTTAAASTAFVQQEITTLIGGAPSTLNDLNELAAAINDDANYNSTLTTALATKLPLAGGTLTGNADFGNNLATRYGGSQQLQIYHNGTRGYITNTSGALWLQTSDFRVYKGDGSERMIQADDDGAVILYHDGNSKLSTTSTGIDVTGTINSGAITSTGQLLVDTDTEHQIKIDASSASGASMHLNTAGGYAYTVYQNSNRIWRIGAYGGSSFTIRDQTGNANSLVIDSSSNSTFAGNINVTGTITGDDGLSIQGGAGNAYLQVGSNTGSWTWKNYQASHKLALEDSDGTGEVLNFSSNGTATFSPSSGKSFVIASDSGDGPYIGTSGNQSLRIITNNTTRITIATSDGQVTVAGKLASDTIDINANVNANAHGLNVTNSALSGAGNLKIAIPASSGAFASSATLNDIVMRNETAGGSIIIGAQDSVQIGVGGSDNDTRLTVNSSGNVGIGTTSAGTLHGASYGTTKLHIDGGTDRGQIIIEGDSLAQIVMSDNGATANSRVFLSQVNDGVLHFKSTNDNGNSKATIMSLTSAGNVGIGIPSPQAKLNVSAPAADRETIRLATYYSPIDSLARGGITWHDGGNITGQIDTRYDGTTVDMHIGSLYSSGYNTTSKMIVKGNGIIETPLQPSFNAYHNSASMSIASGSKFIFNSTSHNVGGMYNTSNGRITAPVAGTYLLTFHTIFQGNYGNAYFQFYVNNARSLVMGDYHLSKNDTSTSYWQTHHISRVIKLAKNDYIEIFARSALQWHGTNWGGLSCHLL